MDKKTTKAISERADNGIVVSVWRSGNNLGICFSKQGKTITWDDMGIGERTKAVQNLYAAADFFAGCTMRDKPDCAHVEQLTPSASKKECS